MHNLRVLSSSILSPAFAAVFFLAYSSPAQSVIWWPTLFRLPEKITIWSPAGNDGFGGVQWSVPIVVNARIAYKQEKFTDINGDQQISKAVCYSESELLTAGAVVLFGESLAIEPPAEADDVRAYTATPSGTPMRKAWF